MYRIQFGYIVCEDVSKRGKIAAFVAGSVFDGELFLGSSWEIDATYWCKSNSDDDGDDSAWCHHAVIGKMKANLISMASCRPNMHAFCLIALWFGLVTREVKHSQTRSQSTLYVAGHQCDRIDAEEANAISVLPNVGEWKTFNETVLHINSDLLAWKLAPNGALFFGTAKLIPSRPMIVCNISMIRHNWNTSAARCVCYVLSAFVWIANRTHTSLHLEKMRTMWKKAPVKRINTFTSFIWRSTLMLPISLSFCLCGMWLCKSTHQIHKRISSSLFVFEAQFHVYCMYLIYP